MKLVKKAHEFAKVAHAGVFRKWSGEPYVEHPARVAAVLEALHFPEKVVAAGYLHDVVEDTLVPIDMIEDEFGFEIASLVAQVTKPVMCKASTSRAERKAAFRKQLAQSSYYGASLKLSDMLDNSANVAKLNPEFAAIYLPELREDVAVLSHGNCVLLGKVKKNLKE